jgi:hypothetical protein
VPNLNSYRSVNYLKRERGMTVQRRLCLPLNSESATSRVQTVTNRRISEVQLHLMLTFGSLDSAVRNFVIQLDTNGMKVFEFPWKL